MSTIGFSDLEEVWGNTIKTSSKARKKLRQLKKESKRGSGKKFNISNDEDPIFGFYDKKFDNINLNDKYSNYDSQALYKTKNKSSNNTYDNFEDDIDLFEIGDLKETFKPSELYSSENTSEIIPKNEIVKYIDVKNNRNEQSNSRNNENYDVFLFVFSGVILLFILEQFIQVGLQLGIRNMKNNK
jgi:hypothetical protein